VNSIEEQCGVSNYKNLATQPENPFLACSVKEMSTFRPRPQIAPDTKPITSNNTFFYIFVGIVVFTIVAGGIAYWWFKPKAKDVTIMGPFVLTGDNGKPTEGSTKPIFDQSQIFSSLGNNFTLSTFVYMNEVTTERIPIAGPEGDLRFKPFLYILGVGDILLDPIHQIARVRIKPLTKTAIIKPDAVTNIDIENFMITRWNQLTITVEGRTVDVYLNGALAKSTLLENLPILNPVGVLLETSPDFSGQTGLFQAWPHRLTESEIAQNYKRNTDTRGKPLIPDSGHSFLKMLKDLWNSLCKKGFCDFRFATGPLKYVDYEYA
jgi:hypothetical protein